MGGSTIKKDFNYDQDSLRRLNSIDLILLNKTIKKTFIYNDDKVVNNMGNATNRILQVAYMNNQYYKYIHQYSYDENNNITMISIGVPGAGLETYEYYYDGFNQLTREDIWIKNELEKTMIYEYDDQNNITSIKEFAYKIVTGTPKNEKKLYYTYNWKDQLSKVEYYVNETLSYFENYVYDNSGNITKINDSRAGSYIKNMEWDGRQLTRYFGSTLAANFKYNDQGIRTQKNYSSYGGGRSVKYILDGDKVLVETRSDGITLYFTYDVDGSLLSMNYNGTEYFYITNLQGDVIELVDINGNTVVKYKYDAWGNIVSQTGGNLADINPYRYRGYRYDTETGWYYLQSRYYNPKIGRFISADSLTGENGNIQTHNMYAYSLNNPVMYIDGDGRFAISITVIGFIVGAVIGATVGGIVANNIAKDNDITGWELAGWTALGVVGGGLIGGAIGAGAGALITKATGVIGLSVTKYSVIPIKSVTVLGNIPTYSSAAIATGSGYYQISNSVYESLPDSARWANNLQYLKDANRLGSSFVMFPDYVVKNGYTLWRELQYLIGEVIPYILG